MKPPLLSRGYFELNLLFFPGLHCTATDFDQNDSEQTKVLLTSAAFVHLKKAHFSKHTRNLSPASRAILLSGTTGKSFGLLFQTIWFMRNFSLFPAHLTGCIICFLFY